MTKLDYKTYKEFIEEINSFAMDGYITGPRYWIEGNENICVCDLRHRSNGKMIQVECNLLSATVKVYVNDKLKKTTYIK